MYEVLDDTATRIILAIESGDSIRRVAQALHEPHETVRQAVNRLEDVGYVRYDEGLSVVDERVRDVIAWGGNRRTSVPCASISVPVRSA